MISDAERLRSLLRRTIDDSYGGNLSSAVKATNERIKRLNASARRAGAGRMKELSQPELWKLTAGKIRSIQESTLLWLLTLLPRDAHPKLEAVVLSSVAIFRLHEYEAFAARHVSIADPGLVDERDRLIARWRRKFPSEFGSFDHLVEARRHSPAAVELAYDRMAGPFVAVSEGGYIEREWAELEYEEQRRYLRAAIKREVLLLERPDDLTRAQTEHSGAGLLHALWFNRGTGNRKASYLFE